MTKQEPRDIRINQIINAAVQEFVDKGYQGASMESIAARAGLSKGGVYHHFNSKDEILIEANQRYMEPVFALMAQARNDESPVHGLKSFITDYIRFWSEHPKELVFTFLSMAKVLSTREMWPGIEEYARYMIAFYSRLLSLGIDCGELHGHDYESRSLALFASMDGIIGYVAMCEQLYPEQVANQIARAFLDDILS